MTTMKIYAKRLPTTDEIVIKYVPNSKRTDVVLFKDPECENEYARIPWHYKGCPTRKKKRITLNCYSYQIVWMN